jgi:dephospho-CoA kinase
MNKQRTILAVVGRDVSGKDTVGKYLKKEYGFSHVVTGQLLRDYIAAKKLGEPTRDLMIKVATDVRARLGADYFLQVALQSDTQRLALDGVRAMGEVAAVREAGGLVVDIEAPIEKRFERAKDRGRTSDEASFEDFVRHEKMQSLSVTVNGQSLDEVIASADHTIHNDASLPELFAKVDLLMKELGLEKIEKVAH